MIWWYAAAVVTCVILLPVTAFLVTNLATAGYYRAKLEFILKLQQADEHPEDYEGEDDDG